MSASTSSPLPPERSCAAASKEGSTRRSVSTPPRWCGPGVRALLAAEILWVIGYAALPVFFILYTQRVLDLDTARASLWLAVFAVAAGAVMAIAGFVGRRGCTSRSSGAGCC